jgi:hypothetical protein
VTDEIIDPTGRAGFRVPEKLYVTGLAERRPSLAGARIGLLHNTKWNSDLLLGDIADLLVAQCGAAAVTLTQTKAGFALPVGDDVVAQFGRLCDVVVTGVGDCGSSSASAVADGMLFEQAGLPAAVICTEAFVATADAMADLRGAPEYDYVVTEHPVAALARDQVRQRGRQLLPEVVPLLTDAGPI